MEIVWSPDSLDRLDHIGDFIAKSNPERAEDFIERLIELVESLKEFPNSGSIIEEHKAFRHVVFQGCRLIYRLHLINIEIVTVIGPRQVFTTPCP